MDGEGDTGRHAVEAGAGPDAPPSGNPIPSPQLSLVLGEGSFPRNKMSKATT